MDTEAVGSGSFCSAASAVVDGKIWLMGGKLHEDDDEAGEYEFADVTDTVVVYDPTNDSWEAGPALPHGVSGHTATVHDGEVHLLSGEGAVFVYRSGAWEGGTAGDHGYAAVARGSILLG